VAVFQATPVHRLLASRASPARPADPPLGGSCSPAVEPHGSKPNRVSLPGASTALRCIQPKQAQSESRWSTPDIEPRRRKPPRTCRSAHQEEPPDGRATSTPELWSSRASDTRRHAVHMTPSRCSPDLLSPPRLTSASVWLSPPLSHFDPTVTLSRRDQNGPENDSRRPYGLCLRVSIRNAPGRHS
jgi:hypothetical protein